MTVMPDNGRSDSDQKAVREQLDRILKSGPFLQSRRRQRFLEFIVNETLAGRGERLKGYNVALEVFDRSEGFDPNVDPVVRMEAGRLRDRLREYYEGEGRSDPIRIDLPKGAYTPKIEFRQAATLEPGPQISDATTPASHLDPMQAPVAPMDEQPSSTRPRQKLSAHWQIAISVLALILVLGAVGTWLYRDIRVPSPEGAAENLIDGAPQGPKIAVLPFVNLSGDPKQEYFTDGLTEDIMTELSRVRDLNVLARNTTFQYKGQAVDVSRLGDELKVRYVLEGTIRRANNQLRVTAQLIDTEAGAHVWADRFDREMDELFVVEDEIVSQIVGKIAGSYGVIESIEARAATRKNPEQIQAYDLVLRAHDAMKWEWNRENFRTAKEMLLEAIALDPSNARARRDVAWLALVGWVFRFDETPVAQHEITSQAIRSVQLDPTDARARMVAASAHFFNKQLDLFENEARQAMALAPNDAEILAVLGCMIAKSGDWRRGVPLVTKANALNAVAAIGWYHSTVAVDYYLKGDYERALELLRQSPDQEPYTSRYYIPIYGQLGRKQEALEKSRKLLAKEQGVTAESFENWYRMWNIREEDIARLMDGVAKSGVVEVEVKAAP